MTEPYQTAGAIRRNLRTIRDHYDNALHPKAGAGGDPGPALAAAALAASDPALRLPSAAAFRAHWPVNAPTGPPAPPNRVRCHEHPAEDAPCRLCRARNVSAPETIAHALAAARAALKGPKETP